MFGQKGQVQLDRKSYLTAQAAIEYLILFATLACLAILSVSTFFPKVKTVGEDLFKNATERIVGVAQ